MRTDASFFGGDLDEIMELFYESREGIVDIICTTNSYFFILFDRTNYMTLCASIIGVTSLIFNEKEILLDSF